MTDSLSSKSPTSHYTSSFVATNSSKHRSNLFMFANGDRYDGEYILTDEDQIMRHGHGKHISADQQLIYEGTWNRDKMHGTGRLTYGNGASYDGEFQSNYFEGLGTYTWPDGAQYTGIWQGSRAIGKAEYTGPDLGVPFVGTANGQIAHMRFKVKITIGVFGLDNAGKTSTVKAIEGSRTKTVVPTVNTNTSMVPYPTTTKRDEKSQERIKIIDVSGARKFREESWSDYYDEIHGLIFVIDASEKKRMRENKNTLDDLLYNDKLRNKPILILVNKQDVKGALDDEDEIKEKLEIEELKIKHKIGFCTAIPNKDKGEDSIRAGFAWLIKTIEDNYTDINSRIINAKNSRQPKPIERKNQKFDESDSDNAVVYHKKRSLSPPLNKFNTDYRSITNSTRLPALDLNKTKPKTSGRETYSEDDDDDDDVNNIRSRLRPVVSPINSDNTTRNRSLNQLNTSTTNTLNKKKKLTGPPSSNKNTLIKKSNDNEPKSYRAPYEPFPEEVPFSSSTKKTTPTDDIMSKTFTKSSITNDPTKRHMSPLVHDTKSYNSSSISKGVNYSDDDDDDKKYLSSLSKNKPFSTSKKPTSGVYGADDDDDDDKINNKMNRRPFGTTPTTTTTTTSTTKKFQKHDDDDENDYSKKTTLKTSKNFDSDDDDDDKKKNDNKTYQGPLDRYNLNNDYRRITSKPPASPSITTNRTKNNEDDFPSTSLSKPLNRSKFNNDNYLSTLSKPTSRSITEDDNDRPLTTSKSNIYSKYNDDDDNFNQRQKNKSTIPSKNRFEDDDDDKKYPSSLSTNKSLATSKKPTSGIYGADDDDDDDKINNKMNRRPFGTTPTTTTTSTAKKFQKHDDDDDDDENDYPKKPTLKTSKNFDSDDDDDYNKKKDTKTYQSSPDRLNLNNDYRRITSKPPVSPSITTKQIKNGNDDFPSLTSKYGTRSKYDNDYSTSSVSKPTTHVKNNDDDDDDDDDDYKSKSKPKVPSKYNNDDGLPSSSSRYGTRSKYDNDYSTSTSTKPTTHSKYSDDDNPSSLSKTMTKSKYGHDDRSPSPPRSTSLSKKPDDKVPLSSSKLTARSKYEDDDDDDDDRPSYPPKTSTRSKYDDDNKSGSPVISKSRSKFEDDEYPSSLSKAVPNSKYDDDDRPTNSPRLTSRSKVLDDDFPSSSSKKNNYSSHDDDFSGRGGVRPRFGYDDFDSSKAGFNSARAGSASANRFRPSTNFDT
ncbi:unnamed protein product [Rotaria sp. Silwood2]|nr:unnamed protein product [Rotaria sp. Silwood2]